MATRRRAAATRRPLRRSRERWTPRPLVCRRHHWQPGLLLFGPYRALRASDSLALWLLLLRRRSSPGVRVARPLTVAVARTIVSGPPIRWLSGCRCCAVAEGLTAAGCAVASLLTAAVAPSLAFRLPLCVVDRRQSASHGHLSRDSVRLRCVDRARACLIMAGLGMVASIEDSPPFDTCRLASQS